MPTVTDANGCGLLPEQCILALRGIWFLLSKWEVSSHHLVGKTTKNTRLQSTQSTPDNIRSFIVLFCVTDHKNAHINNWCLRCCRPLRKQGRILHSSQQPLQDRQQPAPMRLNRTQLRALQSLSRSLPRTLLWARRRVELPCLLCQPWPSSR